MARKQKVTKEEQEKFYQASEGKRDEFIFDMVKLGYTKKTAEFLYYKTKNRLDNSIETFMEDDEIEPETREELLARKNIRTSFLKGAKTKSLSFRLFGKKLKDLDEKQLIEYRRILRKEIRLGIHKSLNRTYARTIRSVASIPFYRNADGKFANSLTKKAILLRLWQKDEITNKELGILLS